MTTIQEGLVAYLEAQVPTAGKGYPQEIPQDAGYPAWAYELIDDEQIIGHGGGTGLHKARIQIDLVVQATESSGAYANAAGLAQLIRGELDGFKGSMGGVQVEYCKTTQSDDWAELHDLPTASFDVMINYKS